MSKSLAALALTIAGIFSSSVVHAQSWTADADVVFLKLGTSVGTADDNVHPNNSMQLIRALQQAGKNFEVQVGPDAGHTALNQQRMMEFFIQSLVVEKASTATMN